MSISFEDIREAAAEMRGTSLLGDLHPFADYCAQVTDIQAHLPRLRNMVIDTQAKVVVELGTRYGYSTAAFVHGVQVTQGHVTAVDDAHDAPFTDPQFTFIRGNDLDQRVLRKVPKVIDLLFIDTSHTLFDTVRELALYGPRVREGGLIVCHDTELPGVHDPLRAWYLEHGTHWLEWREAHGLAAVYVGPQPE